MNVDPSKNNEPLEFNHIKKKTSESTDQSIITSSTTVAKNGDNTAKNTPAFKNINRQKNRNNINGSIRENRSKEKTEQQAVSTTGPYLNYPHLGMAGLLPTPLDTTQWNSTAPSTSSMSPFAMMGMAADPTIYGMMGVPNFGQFGLMRNPHENTIMGAPPGMGVMLGGAPIKEILRFSSCVLYPPKPNAPFPTTRERPPGCRTVFVGGLPDNITEEIIREVFQKRGPITTIRMSKKNFCHIRFEEASYVDNAIYLSGYRIIIGDMDTDPNTGRLHVDYAQARDDHFGWECAQRALQREMRHRQKTNSDLFHPPSPPPIAHYSEYEATQLLEQLKNEETFSDAVQTLSTWLERGECSKRNCGHFYSMIQSTNSHVRRLMSDKILFEEELIQAKELLKQRVQNIITQFTQIEKVFMAANHQKVWDHFTKAQRKNIDMWSKQAQEIKNAQLDEILMEREEDEMEMSDQDEPDESESSSPIAKKLKTSGNEAKACRGPATEEAILREENDSLRCQLEAYLNEAEVLRSENAQNQKAKEQQVMILNQALQNVQQQLQMVSQQRIKETEELKLVKMKLNLMKQSKRVSSKDDLAINKTDEKNKDNSKEKGQSDTHDALSKEFPEEGDDDHSLSFSSPLSQSSLEITSTSCTLVPEKHALLIGVISNFLHVHPFGATVDYIWSYLHQLDPVLLSRDVESILTLYPSVFRQEISGVGASIERKWKFIGYNTYF